MPLVASQLATLPSAGLQPAAWRQACRRAISGTAQALVALGLVGLLSLGCVAPVFAAGATPQGTDRRAEPPAERRQADEPRPGGPRNPYDMKALQQFDAGSHRAEEPG